MHWETQHSFKELADSWEAHDLLGPRSSQFWIPLRVHWVLHPVLVPHPGCLPSMLVGKLSASTPGETLILGYVHTQCWWIFKRGDYISQREEIIFHKAYKVTQILPLNILVSRDNIHCPRQPHKCLLDEEPKLFFNIFPNRHQTHPQNTAFSFLFTYTLLGIHRPQIVSSHSFKLSRHTCVHAHTCIHVSTFSFFI